VREDRSPDLSLFFSILHALEDIGARYAIIGAFAGGEFGVMRATYDIDIVVDLTEAGIQALVTRYPSPRYYADPEQMRDSIRMGIMFNIIDSSRAEKADLLPVTMHAEYRSLLVYRLRRRAEGPDGEAFDVWLANPTDVVIGKLMAWAEGRSRKHETDIYDMLVYYYVNGPEASPMDELAIERAARALGPDVLNLWHAAQEAAHRQVEGGGHPA
jgi:hypothetical protein